MTMTPPPPPLSPDALKTCASVSNCSPDPAARYEPLLEDEDEDDKPCGPVEPLAAGARHAKTSQLAQQHNSPTVPPAADEMSTSSSYVSQTLSSGAELACHDRPCQSYFSLHDTQSNQTDKSSSLRVYISNDTAAPADGHAHTPSESALYLPALDANPLRPHHNSAAPFVRPNRAQTQPHQSKLRRVSHSNDHLSSTSFVTLPVRAFGGSHALSVWPLGRGSARAGRRHKNAADTIGLEPHQQRHQPNGVHATTNGHRPKSNGVHTTVSQSMCALDELLRASAPKGCGAGGAQAHTINGNAGRPAAPFCVTWRNLSLVYKSGGGGSGGGNCLRDLFKLAKSTPGAAHSEPRAQQQWRRGELRVLDNICGRFKSNQLVAVIGPSGCGKTSLLRLLAGSLPSCGPNLSIAGLARPRVAFIGQDDCLLPGLTARETLLYASRLQNSTANFDHARHIEPILHELGLHECANRDVTKLSGGQARRVAIAQELLYPTNLLVLDEVTSGLDASTSYAIVKMLKQLVADKTYPMSIVISIHQPSAKLFGVFDRVYAMSEGSCLYEGSCRAVTIGAHLARFGLKCPKFHNMADYLIEIASATPQAAGSHVATAAAAAAAAAAKHQSAPIVAARQQMIEYHRKRWLQAAPAPPANGAGLRGCSPETKVAVAVAAVAAAAATATATATRPSNLSSAHTTDDDDDDDGALQEPEYEKLLDDASCCELAASQLADEHSLYAAIERARAQRQKPLLSHLFILSSRSWVRIRRSYILTYLQLATYILLGTLLGTFYGTNIGARSGCPRLASNLIAYVVTQRDSDAAADADSMTAEMRAVQENLNFLLVTIMTATFAALEITVITFPLEAKSVKREWRNGWYRVSSYFLGRTLADLPFQLAFVFVFCVITYHLTGQIGITTWRFGAYCACMVMTALVAQSFGFIFGALFMNNLPAAVFVAPLAIFPALLFSGFFSRLSHIPTFYKPMTYISHFRFTFDAVLVSLYGYQRCECQQSALDSYHNSMPNQTSQIGDLSLLLLGMGAGGGGGANSAAQSNYSSPAPPPPPTAAATHAPADDTELINRDDANAIKAANSSLASAMDKAVTSLAEHASVSSTGGGGGGGGGQRHHQQLPAEAAPLAAQLSPELESALVDTMFEQALRSSNVTAAPQLYAHNSAALATNASDIFATAALTTTTVSPAPLDAATSTDALSGELTHDLAHKFATRVTDMIDRQLNYGHPMPTSCANFNAYMMSEFELTNDELFTGLMWLMLIVVVTRFMSNLILCFTIGSRN